MQETSKYTIFNIREYLGDGSHGLGEDTLLQVLSEFSCIGAGTRHGNRIE